MAIFSIRYRPHRPISSIARFPGVTAESDLDHRHTRHGRRVGFVFERFCLRLPPIRSDDAHFALFSFLREVAKRFAILVETTTRAFRPITNTTRQARR